MDEGSQFLLKGHSRCFAVDFLLFTVSKKRTIREGTVLPKHNRETMGTASRTSAVLPLHRAPLLLVLGVLALLSGKAFAQVGTTICGCQPAVYEITLSFNVTCDLTNVQGPGINETACVTSKETDEDVTDFVPAVVTQIQFLELNRNLVILQQETRDGSFRDGNVVRYTSVLAVQDSFDETTLPRAFQMIIRGFNAIDQPIQTTWVITYDNDCGIFPILFEGQQIGWSVFVSLLSFPQLPSSFAVFAGTSD